MLLAVVVASVSVGAGRATPPHIVHIMADDTGVRTTSRDRSGPGWLGLAGLVLTCVLPDCAGQWNDLGYKNSMIRSPSLDKLATEGVQLTSHCAPPPLPC